MLAGDSQTLRNKRHFVISVIAMNVFFCTVNISCLFYYYFFPDQNYFNCKLMCSLNSYCLQSHHYYKHITRYIYKKMIYL